MTLVRLSLCAALCAPGALAQLKSIALDSVDALIQHKVKAESVTYKGKKAVKVTDAQRIEDEDRLVIVKGVEFGDGVIEAEISGEPGPGAAGGARGFVGIAFRVAADVSKFECFYLRPTNGRAEDQERRNHSAQYISFPGFPWSKLRKETPSKYESYVDLQPGEWTKVRIEVKGEKARLFVHGNAQPVLIVNDLKQTSAMTGGIALWTGPGTVAHFTGLKAGK